MVDTPQNVTPDDQTMEARYQRAMRLVQGMGSNKVVRNDILFPHWIAQSDSFWYERRLKNGKQYRLVDAKAKTNTLAFDHEALAQALTAVSGQGLVAEDLPINKVDIRLSPLQVTFNAFDSAWTFDAETAVCRQIEVTPENGVFSPDGTQTMFARDYNLWVRDLTSGEERALTHDGREDFAYAVEGENYGGGSDILGNVQARWSPDGTTVFTVLRDTREVKNLPVVHHVPMDGSVRPTVVNYKIALPGDSGIPEYHLLAIAVASGKVQHAHYPSIPALINGRGYFNTGMGWWASDSRRAYFVDQTRDYQTTRVVEFDTATGETRVLFTETSTTHLSLAPGLYEYPVFIPLPDTHELIWWSERTGWGHLYLYDLNTGELKQTITQGDWLVRHIVQINPERRTLFVQTAGRVANRDPYYQDLCEIHIDSGEISDIASSDHEYTVLSKFSLIGMGPIFRY